MNFDFKKDILPHLLAVLCLLVLTCVYFYPALTGKVLNQHDTASTVGWRAEIDQYVEKGEPAPIWTNTMFSGMPSFQMYGHHAGNWWTNIYRFITLSLFKMHNPIGTIFLCMLGLYILLCVLRLPPVLSAIGGSIFGLSAINAILIDAGHINKLIAVGYAVPFIAGVILIFKRKYWWGAFLTALTFCFEIIANHYQMTLYLLLLMLVFGVVELIFAARENRFPDLAKGVIVAVLAVIMGILPNFSTLWSNVEYAEETIRGKAILTKKDVGQEAGKSGLDKEYAFQWSYGITESMNFLIPHFTGGGSQMPLTDSSESYAYLAKRNRQQAKQFIKNVPTYWGSQPSTAGPFYFGAGILMLFLLGLMIVKNTHKWWLAITAFLMIMIAWGKNFAVFNYILFDYFPMFNKFRAFTSSLSFAHLCVVALGALAVYELLKNESASLKEKNGLTTKVLISGGVLGGICLFFAIAGGSLFDFKAAVDAQLQGAGYPKELISAIRSDRASMLTGDAWRSFFIILATTGAIYLFLKEKIKGQILLLVLGGILLGDVWLVSKRYQNADDFVSKSKAKQKVAQSTFDKEILRDKDPHYRVMNLATSTFSDSYTAAHHKTIGGYHAAKLRRYQDMVENHISQNNQAVMNMLNTKYLIAQQGGNSGVIQNRDALGNAWFVNNYEIVNTNQAEIDGVSGLNPSEKAVIHKEFSNELSGLNLKKDSLGSIRLTSYHPDRMEYKSKASSEQLAVFSEVWYNPEKGWQAYIDGKPVNHIRANYILRALRVPSGEHTIVFEFKPASIYTGKYVSMAGSVLLILLMLGAVFQLKRKN